MRTRGRHSEHICHQVDYCLCDVMALEPNEDCPIHGHGEFPPRCMICGKFMKWEVIIENPWTP